MLSSVRHAALLVFVFACSGGAPSDKGGEYGGGGWGQPAEQGDRRILVEVEAVERGSVADHLETAGTIESEAQADITAETSGTVTQVMVEEGDDVRRGQLLALIENPSLDASASRATIELERAEADLERARTLHAQQAISDTELRQAEISYRTAQASAQEAQQTQGFTRVTSPIDGTVAIRDVRVGEVASGRVFQVVDLHRLRVIVQLPEKDLSRVHVGQAVHLSGAYDEDSGASGTVARISPVVDATSGTVRVTIQISPDQQILRPGQFARVRIEVDRHSDVITIPRRALVWEDGEPVAWVVTDAPPPEAEAAEEEAVAEADAEPKAGGGLLGRLFGKGDQPTAEDENTEEETPEEAEDIPQRVVERRVLDIGYQDTEQVEISEGLQEGEPVVVLGNANLREGSAVRLPEDPAPRSQTEPEPEEEE